jgi:hypothetical protein
LSQEIGNIYLIAACLTGLAAIQQQPRHSVKILSAAQAAFEQSGEFVDPLYSAENGRTEKKIRELLHMSDIAKLWEEGRALMLEQAVTFALVSAK